MPTELRPYQRRSARAIWLFNGRALLALEMRLGKTLTALYWMARTKTKPVVVVCPAAVKYVWEDEAAKHLNLLSCVLEGRKARMLRSMSWTPLIIVNYQILGAWLPVLRKLRPQAVFIDESQAIKNAKTQRFQHVKELCEGVPNVVALSGTPLTNRHSELWTTLHILHPDQFASFYQYAFKYCVPKKRPWGMDFSKSKNSEALHALLKETCMIRLTKDEVFADLPKKQRQVVPIALSNRQEYDEASTEFLQWLRKHASSSAARRAAKAQAVVKVGYLLRLAARLKLPSSATRTKDSSCLRSMAAALRGCCVEIMHSQRWDI